jgi:hypothetical protein
MRKHGKNLSLLGFATLMVGGSVVTAAYAESSPAKIEPPPTAEVLVTAERPGPRLWQVTSGERTVWILGTQSPLPQKLRWRSAEVEAAIAGADEVLGAYTVSLRMGSQGWQRRSTTLEEDLPRKVYARWTKMRDRYIDPRIPTEELLPASAAYLLQMSAFEHNGMTSSDEVWRTIYGLARLHDVPVRPQSYEVESPVTKVSKRAAREAGVRCLVQTMDRLEVDMTESRRRAEAWADGDMKMLRELARSDQSYSETLARSWPFLGDEDVDRLIGQETTRLAAVIERAMIRNRRTFAALPVHMLMKEDGVLSILRAAGHRVEEPVD